MAPEDVRFSFGPVPSRRLGKSLGINNIPPKVCSYSCVYCQVGSYGTIAVDRCSFYEPEEIFRDAERRLAEARAVSAQVDYLAFVPDGEPTLDGNLGKEIRLLKSLGVPLAVITNGSLLWREDVREDLALADWVSVKIDAVREETWRAVNRPHKSLSLDRILEGILSFSRYFRGELATETMLIRDRNDSAGCVEEIAGFLLEIRPQCAYLAVPTRPPAEGRVRRPSEEALVRAHRILAGKVAKVELLIGYEGDSFTATGDAMEDLPGIAAVHPMREEAVAAFLARAGYTMEAADRLVARGLLARTVYDGHTYFIRRLSKG